MHDHGPPKPPPGSPDDVTLGAPGFSADAGSPAGVQVPGYRVLGLLGVGGMGAVYLAEQERPRRQVALKIVRGGPVADELSLRLFQREADTLARLRHPDIAALHEVGRTAAGQHYLTMELVRGPTLAEWLAEQDRRGPATEAARRRLLTMFRNICEAVHYAHQRGVIHRDLKPSNLIVLEEPASASSTRDGGVPRVVILDFGLARMADADGEGEAEALLSQPGVVRGTLAYMSPEQARGDRDLLDLRSDVYSLGVILYEMLTGKRPYEVEGISFLDAIRVVSAQPPHTLARNWPGGGRPDPDLETIVAKALSKEPSDRYGSAAALGEDVERHLTRQPILARPPSTMYQLRKLVARRKAPFAVAGLVVLLIASAAVGMGALYLRADRNLARALVAERSAQTEAETARRTAEFLVDLFDASSPDRARGETLTAREVMDTGARRIERELAGEPGMQARLMTTIGHVYRQLALYDESLRLVEGGLDLRRRTLPPSDPALGASLTERGLTLEELGRIPEAEAAFRAAIAQLESAAPPDTTTLIAALGGLGWLLGQHGSLEEAALTIDRALALHAERGGGEDATMIKLLSKRSTVEMDAGRPGEARALLERALALSRRISGDKSPATADVLTNLGVAYGLDKQPEKSEGPYREALAIREQVYGESHPLVARAVANVGLSLAEQGRLAEALPWLERSMAILQEVLGPDHPDIGRELTNLGLMNLQLGNTDQAIELLERARAVRERALGPDDPALGYTLFHLASARFARREFGAARRLFERVVELDTKNVGPNHPDVAEDLESLAEVLRAMGDEAGAGRAEARMNAIRAFLAANEHPEK